MIVTLLTFIVNFIIVSIILCTVQLVYPFHSPEITYILNYIHKPVTIESVSMLCSIIILGLSFLLAHTPPMQFLLLKTMGCRKPNNEEKSYLESIISILCQRTGKSPSDYHLYVKDDDRLNAFALGHNNICVFTSLLYNFTASEVAGILAHEMGHIAHHDTSYGLGIAGISWAGNMIVRVYVFGLRLLSILAIIPIIGWVIALVSWLIQIQLYIIQILLNLPLNLISLFNGRQQEYAADRYACEIGLGRDLYAALSKIMNYTGERKSGFFSSFYDTHPATTKRLKRIAEFYNN